MCRTLKVRGAGAAIVLAAVVGCGSRFREVHYFKSTADDGRPINYYRVTVEGSTGLSSSRYLSGYFDERAVDLYFSKFSQPAEGTFTGTVKKDEEGKVEPLGEGQEGRRLVLILSSNSDEIATSISAMAQSEAVTQTLANLIGRERLEAATNAKLDAPAQAKKGEYLVNSGKTLIADLPDDADLAKVKANFLAYANELANFLEPGRQFGTLAEAQAWAENRREDR